MLSAQVPSPWLRFLLKGDTMFEHISLEQLFRDTPGATILPITQLLTRSTVAEYINNLFLTKVGLGFIASCACGDQNGNFQMGTTCPKCWTTVTNNLSHELRYQIWIEIPEFAPPVLAPKAASVLAAQLGSVKIGNTTRNWLDVLRDKESVLPPRWADQIECGTFAFYRDFDRIMDILFATVPRLKGKGKATEAYNLRQWLTRYRHCLFTRHLPVLDPSLHLISQFGKSKSVDPMAPIVIEAVTELSVLVHHNQNRSGTSANKIDQQLFKFCKKWEEYTTTIQQNMLFRKHSWIRQAVMGNRLHFTFRAVIVPIVEGEYPSDMLLLPWSIGVVVYKLEIINLLINRYNKSLEEALIQQENAEVNFDPMIREILDTLIKESPYPGLPLLYGRNPSIRHGGIQRFFGLVKNDPADYTVGYPPTCVTGPNADFDGDEMYGSSIKLIRDAELAANLSPAICMIAGDEPGITSTVCITPQARIALQALLMEHPECSPV